MAPKAQAKSLETKAEGAPVGRLVGPVVVDFVVPILEDGLGLGDVGEVLDVEALGSQAPVEGLREGCLPARCRLNVALRV